MKAALFAAALAAFTISVGAATFRVDDSASLPGESNTQMQWRSLAPTRGASNIVEGSNLVTVRLNTAPWVNRMGKIYMALPEQPIGEVAAEWTTQGRLLPGELTSGHRTLVYAGPIRSSVIEDTIRLKVAVDGRRLESTHRLQFYFEIDIE